MEHKIWRGFYDLQHTCLSGPAWDCHEDWSGITNQKERKRLQNRLNKRAYLAPNVAPGFFPPDAEVLSSEAGPPFDYNSLCETAAARVPTIPEQSAPPSCDIQSPCANLPGLTELDGIDGFAGDLNVLGFPFDWLLSEVVRTPLDPCTQNERQTGHDYVHHHHQPQPAVRLGAAAQISHAHGSGVGGSDTPPATAGLACLGNQHSCPGEMGHPSAGKGMSADDGFSGFGYSADHSGI
ncbi:hypothetical protein PgNI_06638 [Pyricularia grisea]|uniref:Uncharacterized protein n=1 Tax=Pyricularia grisea TaxID=148305 RepID=A0A6P8B3V6_PYRGI|nr:hypothetical protein PgNI_06638 [Pyricularia grisea]TLD09987.1 hypothetical protein PgNI_06638 [Pyricularia grisea]